MYMYIVFRYKATYELPMLSIMLLQNISVSHGTIIRRVYNDKVKQ